MKTTKKISKWIKKFIPPVLLEAYLLILAKKATKYGWFGNYATWEDAKLKCSGYDSDIIIEKVKNSLLKVKNGEVVYERDSVVFNQIEYSWPLLAILQKIAIENNHTLNLIDYGGSLGSSYFQNKDFLANFGNIQWNIVEQKKFVDVGKRYFESEQLSFFYTIEDCIEFKKSKVIVISNVIQYLESPLEFIQSLIAHKFDYIVFDKTSFVKGESDVITVQIVPPEIYTASYPCWFFNEKNFLKEFENGYSLEYTFDVPIQVNYENSYYKGFVFKRLI